MTEVGREIDNGWEPQGGLTVFHEYKNGQIYAQAMVLPSQNAELDNVVRNERS